jgi:octaprenyl-diphosphate synthase
MIFSITENKGMNAVDIIKQPITQELLVYEEAIRVVLLTDNSLLNQLTTHVLSTRGKQMRPIMSLLVAQLCGKVTEQTINGSIAIELLHIASLIHDDVLDNSLERRNKPSVNALFENKIAILGGDFLFSKALEKAAETQNMDIIQKISRVGANLADGEILQLANSKKFKITEDIYIEIIFKKTASLFASCAQIGALSAGANPQQIRTLGVFGECVGMCFQLRDDIFDYYSDNIGKPTGNDIREGKITLPMLYALTNSTNKEKARAYTLLQKAELSGEEVSELQQFSIKKGGVDYARNKMYGYREKAIAQLDAFEESDTKRALIAYTHYVVDRDR